MDNKNIFSKNLKKYMDLYGKSRRQICEELGFNYYTFSDWVNAKKYPRMDKVELLAEYFGIKKSDLIEERNGFSPLDIPGIIPLEPMDRIPLLGAIACGDPILAQENIEDYIDLPRTIKADFALTCEGDSMIDAGIKDGDVVYIRSQPEVQNGQIAAVLVDGESATLKRFFFNDGVVTLMAANQSYSPIVKAGSDVEQVRVLGLAVGLSRSFFK